jgi:hypothetical protein
MAGNLYVSLRPGALYSLPLLPLSISVANLVPQATPLVYLDLYIS